MSDTVIKIENLSKQYRLGTVGTGTLSHDLNRWWAKLRGKPDPYLKVDQLSVNRYQLSGKAASPINEPQITNNARSACPVESDEGGKGPYSTGVPNNESQITKNNSRSEYIYALRDINLEVKQGEVLGIIGRNGAGKSTLLKILSRVTAPTTGQVKVKGRIAALLEVGTGFHPELTGRENIYLNGAIMGMTKDEVRAKLDEIVDFSGCEKYIDTPVKRYSSGMTVRLGFAVAAHLEPEILIVDEVLAVGDAEFQKKCIGKMHDVAGQGRTVLLVSHNMTSIRRLCATAIQLDSGLVKAVGSTDDVVSRYLAKSHENRLTFYKSSNAGFEANYPITPVEMHLLDENGKRIEQPIFRSQRVLLKMVIEVKELKPVTCIAYEVYDSHDNRIFFSGSKDQVEETWPRLRVGTNALTATFPVHFLRPGSYKIVMLAYDHQLSWHLSRSNSRAVLHFAVEEEKDSSPYLTTDLHQGIIRPSVTWRAN